MARRGAAHRGRERHPVDGGEGTQVHDLQRDPLLGGNGRRVQSSLGHRPPGQERGVGAVAQDLGLVHGGGPLLENDFALDVVAALGLQENHGIGAGDGLLDHPVGVMRIRRGDYLQAGGVAEIGLGRFGMVLDGTDPAAIGDAHHHRHGLSAGGTGVQLGDLRHQLIEGGEHEAVELDLDDRPVAAHRQADSGAHDAGFSQGRVDDAVRPELGLKPLRDTEHPPELADVLAGQQDLGVGLEGAAQPEVEGLRDSVGHGYSSPAAHSAYSRRWASRATVFSA